MLAEALNHKVQDLQLLTGPCYIMDKTVKRCAQFPNALFCTNIRVMGMHLSTGDVLFWQNRAGKVRTCGHEQESFFVVLEMWEEINVWTDHASTWRATSRRREVVDAIEVEMACAWRQLDGGEFLVVRH